MERLRTKQDISRELSTVSTGFPQIRGVDRRLTCTPQKLSSEYTGYPQVCGGAGSRAGWAFSESMLERDASSWEGRLSTAFFEKGYPWGSCFREVKGNPKMK